MGKKSVGWAQTEEDWIKLVSASGAAHALFGPNGGLKASCKNYAEFFHSKDEVISVEKVWEDPPKNIDDLGDASVDFFYEASEGGRLTVPFKIIHRTESHNINASGQRHFLMDMVTVSEKRHARIFRNITVELNAERQTQSLIDFVINGGIDAEAPVHRDIRPLRKYIGGDFVLYRSFADKKNMLPKIFVFAGDSESGYIDGALTNLVAGVVINQMTDSQNIHEYVFKPMKNALNAMKRPELNETSDIGQQPAAKFITAFEGKFRSAMEARSVKRNAPSPPQYGVEPMCAFIHPPKEKSTGHLWYSGAMPLWHVKPRTILRYCTNEDREIGSSTPSTEAFEERHHTCSWRDLMVIASDGIIGLCADDKGGRPESRFREILTEAFEQLTEPPGSQHRREEFHKLVRMELDNLADGAPPEDDQMLIVIDPSAAESERTRNQNEKSGRGRGNGASAD